MTIGGPCGVYGFSGRRCLVGDGSVKLIRAGITPRTFLALDTRAGDEIPDGDW